MKKFRKFLVALTLPVLFLSCKSTRVEAGAGRFVDENLVPVGEISEKAAVNKDFEVLRSYLTDGYVGYDFAKKNGFNVDRAISRMKMHYVLSRNSHKTSKKRGKYYITKAGVDNWAMGYAIGRVLREDLKKYGDPDGHFVVTGRDNGERVYPKKWTFFSDLYFEKAGDDFILADSAVAELLPGMKYTGDVELLQKTVHKNREMYHFVVFQDVLKEKTKINLNGKNYTVPVHYVEPLKIKENHIGFLETDDLMYVSLSDCELGVNQSKELHEKLTAEFNEVLEKAKNGVSKQKVIIDLRGNAGGYRHYLENLLAAILYGNVEHKNVMFHSFLDHFYSGKITLVSPVIAKQAYNKVKNTPGFSDETVMNAKKRYDEQLAEPQRYLDGLYNPVMSKLPQVLISDFKGQIFILMDEVTASAAEIGIAVAHLENKDLVTLIGTKTSGCIEFGGVYDYKLPYSETELVLAVSQNKNIASLAQNPKWHGDTYGFYPDYLARADEILDTLVFLTKDEGLRKSLAGIGKGQL